MRALRRILVCLLLLSSSPTWAQTEPSVIVMRVVETIGKVRIVIARGNAEPEVVEFNGGFVGKSSTRVAVEYQRVVAKLYAEGYVLQGTLSEAGEANLSRSLLFVKAPKP